MKRLTSTDVRISTTIFCVLLHFSGVGQGKFIKVDARQSRLDFVNSIQESDSLHVFAYEYLYNGHGVGVADFNLDGLPDLFFSGNRVPSRLYLNRGGLRFEDVTAKTGLVPSGTWATGVSVADVNGDGLQDIYVCHSGPFSDSMKFANELLINTGIKNGIPQFENRAASYGLNAPGTLSTQAAFFDYDRDGDLDMFLLNHSNHTVNPFLNTRKLRTAPDMRFGNRLFRHDMVAGQPAFTDVTLSAGIINNALNFGLSVTVSDIDNDGWPDLYTTSDYTETDCFYINDQKGGFVESLKQSFTHVSKYSMGSDVADYNNDGLMDVLTLDMLPEDNHRQKLLKGPDEYDQYHLLTDSGYYHQQMRNMLHLNRGMDANGQLRFSEIGQLAGISNTDWSWAGLFADLDNDGWKDLFITNGYLRDFTDLDFLKYTVADAQIAEAKKGNFNFKTFDLVKKMPSNKLSSYAFRNTHDLRFEDMSRAWGLFELSVSNGAAYADFDRDGDLDLIICRNNEPVALYENNVAPAAHHYLQVNLQGEAANTAALGAKVYVYTPGLMQVRENYPVRGYQSSVADELLFGLAGNRSVDSIVIEWPGGAKQLVNKLEADSTYRFTAPRRKQEQLVGSKRTPIFTDITSHSGADFCHHENPFIDFKDEVLLPYQLSREGPALAAADVNADGLSDFFVGGAIEQAGVLYLQQADGTFQPASSAPWQADAACEDVDAVFFDADGDHDPDLYVVSGGNEYGDGSPEYQDRLYMNDGNGNFHKAADALPDMKTSKQTVAFADYDNDGDLDLFVGGKAVPGSFPIAARSYLLENRTTQGTAKFEDVTAAIQPSLLKPGMVSCAAWHDLDKDGYPELLIGGDWMPLMLFQNTKGRLETSDEPSGLAHTSGMWSAISVADVDGDGDADIIAGNAGTNLPFKATAQRPMEMFVADFDGDQRMDPIICYDIQGKMYPMASRDELLEQVNALKKKFVYYKDYADATISDIFPQKKLKAADTLFCETLESAIFFNDGNSHFSKAPLPAECQFSKVSGIIAHDLDKDGASDLLVAGNFFPYQVRLGRNDASMGVFLKGNGKGKYEPVEAAASGLFASGDVRKVVLLSTQNGHAVLVAKNDDFLQLINIK